MVSIILPVYNGASYLENAIVSVLNQTYRNFELIIIDDASTDHSLQIVEYYRRQDTRILAIRSSMRRGVAKTLNIGLRAAGGDFIARIDADDLWLPEKLEQQVKVFNSDPELLLLGTAKILIDQNGDVIYGKSDWPVYSYGDIRNNILKKNLFSHSSVMFRKSVLTVAGYYNEDYKNSEDYEYWIRIITRGKTEILRESLVQYRLHPEMISWQKRRQQKFFVIKAKWMGFSLLGFQPGYLPYLARDVYEWMVPDFMIRLKRKLMGV